jgi:TolB-like protein/class 3 adenylate cyclase
MQEPPGRSVSVTNQPFVERRLVAILAADVVGFSRLIGEDEVGAVERLRELRAKIVEPLIAEQSGRIFKLMGDGMLAEFPSAVLALRAAIGIQDSLKDRNAAAPAGQLLELRMAVHQGDVIVENGDLLGDGVNIAARLETLAEPGGICISARVYEDATGKIELDAEDMGEQKLKNIARPVRVYRLKLDPPNFPPPDSKRPAISSALPPLLPLPRAASMVTAPGLVYADFATTLKIALRDFHRPDLLAQNPLLRLGVGNLGGSTGPAALELQTWLSEAARALFSNPRDEKLHRVIDLTYFQPAIKPEAVAERLSLSFGAYRRQLTTARNRLARCLWESLPATSTPSAAPSAGTVAAAEENTRDETSPSLDPAKSAPRLSLLVLPFVNVGGNTEHDHFVDGVTETLTTDLFRISGLFVISRNTAGNYKGRSIDIRQIGLELGVRYVVEGSVQSAGNRVRISAQLIDAESGAHLWAERFDKPYADLLDTQDEVSARLARAIHVELVAGESRRATREHGDRLDSLDHALNGWAAWNQPLSLEAARKARGFFEAALRLDEHNVSALLGLANAHMWEVNMYVSNDREAQIRAAEAAAAKALAMNPNAADVHVTYGTVLFAMRAPEHALREFELAVSLDSNLALAHGYLGLMKFFLGRAPATRSHISEAMRLSPRDPLLFHWHFFIGVADLYLGRMGSALESLRKSVEINPNWGLSQFVLAGALALKGLPAEAAEVCAAARRLSPNFTIAKFRAEAVSDNPVYLTQRERLHEALRLAGAPER